MMTWAETAAREEGITREQADKWSVRSHQRACAATESGKFKEEIVPIVIAQKKGKSLVIETDTAAAKRHSL